MTAGPIPRNSAKLLGSTRFKNFIESIKEKNIYDYIVINNTPLLGLTDSLLVCEKVDIVLLAVSINKVNKNLVRESVSRISKIPKFPIFGLVPNFLERYEYSFYGYDNYLNYSNTLSQYYKKDKNLSEKTNESNIKKMYKNYRYFYKIYKNINKFIRWLNK